MKRLSGYPNWFHYILLLALLLVIVSGFIMIPTMLEFKFDVDVFWRLNGERRVGVAALHSGISLFLLLQTGALWHAHMRAGWRKKLNRSSGVITAVAIIALAISALGLFYFGDETFLQWSSISHTSIGVLLLVAAIFHIIKGRSIYAQKHSNALR